jgi:hypothetical protein
VISLLEQSAKRDQKALLNAAQNKLKDGIVTIERGQNIASEVIAREDTLRKLLEKIDEAEEKLKESETQLQAIAESAKESIKSKVASILSEHNDFVA